MHAGRGGRRNAPEVEDANGAISRNGGEDTDPAPGDVMHFPIVGDQLCVNHSHLQPAEANLNAYCCVRLSVEWCVVLDLMTGALSVGRGLSSTACLRLLALLIPKAKFKLLHVAEIRQQIEVIKVSIDPHNLGLVMWTCDSQMWAEEVRGEQEGVGGWGERRGDVHLYIPNGARGVDAGCAQALGVRLVPVEGCERRTELAVLVLHLSQAASNKNCHLKESCCFPSYCP